MKKTFANKIDLPKNYMQDSLAKLRTSQEPETEKELVVKIPPDSSPGKTKEAAATHNTEIPKKTDKDSLDPPAVEKPTVNKNESRVGENPHTENTKGKKEVQEYLKGLEGGGGSIMARIDTNLHTELKLIATLGKGSMIKLLNNIVKEWMIVNESEIKKAKRNGHF